MVPAFPNGFLNLEKPFPVHPDIVCNVHLKELYKITCPDLANLYSHQHASTLCIQEYYLFQDIITILYSFLQTKHSVV